MERAHNKVSARRLPTPALKYIATGKKGGMTKENMVRHLDQANANP